MPTGDSGKVTVEEVEKVKNLIEKCIMKYMKMKEVIDVLYQQHNIEPCFTKIIWKNLEEQNKDFFRNYHLRLALIDQITRFNNLLDKQASLMNQLNRNEVATCLPMQPVPSDLPPSGFNNYAGYPFNTLLSQNPNTGMTEQRVNNNGIRMVEQRMNNIGIRITEQRMNNNGIQMVEQRMNSNGIRMIEQRMNNNGIPMNNGSASVSSSSNMDLNPHQLERTFTDDLNAYLSQHLGYSYIDSNGIQVHNQGENNGVTNISSNLNFLNSRFIEMPQRSYIFPRQLENGST